MARNRKPNGQNPNEFDPDRGTYSEEAAVAWVEPPPPHVAWRNVVVALAVAPVAMHLPHDNVVVIHPFAVDVN